LFFGIFTNLSAQEIVSKIELSKEVHETSGLELVDDNLITLNDSGNPASLYYLNYNGEIIFERNFDYLQNNDWEDLAADDKFIYIADFGNNFDTRDNLRIIKVPINTENNSIELINFNYPEQYDFGFKQISSYDAEALISYENNLIIFTKNRAKQITEIYKVSKAPGNYKAELIGMIDVESIVTAADYDAQKRLLVLTSTSDLNEYYIITIENFDILEIDKISLNKFKIPIGKTQVESIKIIDKSNFWITSEAEIFGSPEMYKVNIDIQH